MNLFSSYSIASPSTSRWVKLLACLAKSFFATLASGSQRARHASQALWAKGSLKKTHAEQNWHPQYLQLCLWRVRPKLLVQSPHFSAFDCHLSSPIGFSSLPPLLTQVTILESILARQGTHDLSFRGWVTLAHFEHLHWPQYLVQFYVQTVLKSNCTPAVMSPC